MRSVLAAVVVLLVSSAGAAAAAQEKPSAWQLVWETEAAAKRLSVEGRARTMALVGKEERDAIATVAAAEGKVRLDYVAPGRQWSLIDDGRELVRLDPGRHQAMALPRPMLAIDRELAERNYVGRIVGEGQVAGRSVWVIDISPRRREGVVQRLWIDRGTGFALKRERYNIDGKLTAGTEYLEVRFGARVAPEVFRVPPGWQRMGPDGRGRRLTVAELSREARFAVRPPRYVPAGYELTGGYLNRGGRWEFEMAELRYTDGLRVMSVFERAHRGEPQPRGGRGRGRGGPPGRGRGPGFGPPGPQQMTLVDRGSHKALRYFGREFVLVVVGDLTPEELVRVARSVD
jgi:outer membrane lipoprotein-sorting protein